MSSALLLVLAVFAQAPALDDGLAELPEIDGSVPEDDDVEAEPEQETPIASERADEDEPPKRKYAAGRLAKLSPLIAGVAAGLSSCGMFAIAGCLCPMSVAWLPYANFILVPGVLAAMPLLAGVLGGAVAWIAGIKIGDRRAPLVPTLLATLLPIGALYAGNVLIGLAIAAGLGTLVAMSFSSIMGNGFGLWNGPFFAFFIIGIYVAVPAIILALVANNLGWYVIASIAAGAVMALTGRPLRAGEDPWHVDIWRSPEPDGDERDDD